VHSRQFIQEQIWRDSQLYKWSRVVDVNVQKLRKKLEADMKNPKHIVTVPGMDYTFQVSSSDDVDTPKP
jgi:DNA-binding response OmpR family regulator